jgi:hypothetical protein
LRAAWTSAGQGAVADLERDVLDGDVQSVGGDLRQHRPGAGADVRRVDHHPVAAVARGRDGGCGLPSPCRIRRAGNAGANQPLTLAPPARGTIVRLPAEALGALAQALDQSPARPGQATIRVDLRLVADPQLHRVDAALDRQLVDRRFERKRSLRLARRAHDRRRRQVQARHAVRRPAA